MASNDDANGTFFAALTANLRGGTTYWFMVATNQPWAASLQLSLQETTPLPPVAGDDFDAATPVTTTPYSDTLDVSRATPAEDDPTDCFGNAASVWYAFTPSESGTLDISTAGSDYDPALGVYTGSRGALSPLACNDDDAGLTSYVSFEATEGVTYYVLAVAAWSSPPGTLQLSATLTPPAPPLTLRLGYDAQAVVDEQTGTVVVTVTVNCSRSVKATITVSVGQQLGNSGPRTGVGKMNRVVLGKGNLTLLDRRRVHFDAQAFGRARERETGRDRVRRARLREDDDKRRSPARQEAEVAEARRGAARSCLGASGAPPTATDRPGTLSRSSR